MKRIKVGDERERRAQGSKRPEKVDKSTGMGTPGGKILFLYFLQL